MSNVEIIPITPEAAIEVASNLRPEDAREVIEGHGHDPMVSIPNNAQRGFCVSFRLYGKTAGIAGITDEGSIWMLCTPVIHEYPIAFARGAKRFIDSRTEPLLFGVVDYRNKAHLRLLKFLGFKFLRKILFGPNQLPFIEFCRV